ncbi:MAG: carbon-nitrogen hydrolase family protein [Planctomycetaceae bacterium]|nr:MAG: carbon-nitrogen hydrolase family protein [Planctomycetaceae bacterium]
MLLSCVQTDVTFADCPANLARVTHWTDLAAASGADLVVFPECMLSGYGYDSREEAEGQGLTTDDPVFDELSAACRRAKPLHLVIGFLESETTASGDRKLYNAAAIIGPNGLVGLYRKVHLPHLGVDRFVDPGEQAYAVHAVGEARVGLGICYDCSFPEPMRVLGLAGADIIALPTNWPLAAQRTARFVPAVRSMENHLYFAAANRIGDERGFTYCGLSSLHGPDGVELAMAAGAEETLLISPIDLATARNKRIERTPGKHVIDRFADRRPAFYTGLNG